MSWIWANLNQNCRHAAWLLSDRQERRLTALERFGLRAHLLGCRSCRRYAAQVRSLSRLLQGFPPSTSENADPPKLAPQARARIAQAVASAENA